MQSTGFSLWSKSNDQPIGMADGSLIIRAKNGATPGYPDTTYYY
ncbi:MAG TPA: hypothetical protein VGO67_05400 [Verrucomicrobiae bacterium]